MKSAIVAQVLAVGIAGGTAHAHIYNFIFGMNGHSVVPPTDSTAKGFARFDYNHHTFNYDLDLIIKGVALGDLRDTGPNGTPLQIFLAPRGQTGDLVLDPGFYGDFVQDGDNIRLTLQRIRLGGNQGAFESDLFTNNQALLDGHLYLQLFTNQYPSGELRGQIPPFGKFLDNFGMNGFVDQAGPPIRHQIPAPAVSTMLALGGAFAARRRRRTC